MPQIRVSYRIFFVGGDLLLHIAWLSGEGAGGSTCGVQKLKLLFSESQKNLDITWEYTMNLCHQNGLGM